MVIQVKVHTDSDQKHVHSPDKLCPFPLESQGDQVLHNQDGDEFTQKSDAVPDRMFIFLGVLIIVVAKNDLRVAQSRNTERLHE